MPLGPLATGVAATVTVVFTIFSCFSCYEVSCHDDGDDDQHGRSYQASLTRPRSVTIQPTYGSLPSPTNTRDSSVRRKPTVKTPPIPDRVIDRNSSYPAQNRISQRAGPSCPPVVRVLSAALIVRDPQLEHSSSPRRLTPALHATSSVDPQPRTTRPEERESLLHEPPLTSLPDLGNLESDGSRNVRGSITAEDLRERARLKKQEMQKAQKLAVRAQKAGNNAAKDRHNRDVHAHRNAITELNKAAAKIIFKEKNKVRRPSLRDVKGRACSSIVFFSFVVPESRGGNS
jgi:hypothetical protein